MKKKSAEGGFTLIEILVVIGIIAVLAAVVLIAINPARQFAQANNSQRTANINAILNAVGQYMADNAGELPAEISSTEQDISSSEADICSDLVPDYMPALPSDPDNGDPVDSTGCGGTYNTGYTIVQDSTTDRITITAPKAKLSVDIEVTR